MVAVGIEPETFWILRSCADRYATGAALRVYILSVIAHIYDKIQHCFKKYKEHNEDTGLHA
jgi:hypothetical protein